MVQCTRLLNSLACAMRREWHPRCRLLSDEPAPLGLVGSWLEPRPGSLERTATLRAAMLALLSHAHHSLPRCLQRTFREIMFLQELSHHDNIIRYGVSWSDA